MWRPLRTNLQRWQANLSDTWPRGKQSTPDHERYAAVGYVGSYRKGLPTVQGVVKSEDFQALLHAVQTRNYTALQGRAFALGDPDSAWSSDLFGPDSSCTSPV
jgi:hypothetical protein